MKQNEKYNFIEHVRYPLAGFINMIKHERAAQIHVVAFIILSIVLIFIPFSILSKIILFASMFLMFIGEAINTAIERVVDLASPDIHPLAKQSKDIAALVVFLFFLLTGIIWMTVIAYEFNYIS